MAGKKKAGRENMMYVSTAGTGTFYTTSVNNKNNVKKTLRKYDKAVRKYVEFLLKSISKSKK